jgi:nitric oxide synthase-interacting protein
MPAQGSAAPSTSDSGRLLSLHGVPSRQIDCSLVRGNKRKFEFDTTEVERLIREAEEDALLQLEKEQAEALRAKLPDFWLPSLTPTYASKGPPRSLTEIKLQTACRGGNPSHKLSYVTRGQDIYVVSTSCRKKDLISVRFSYPSTVDLQWHKQPRPTAPTEEPLNPRKAEETESPICPSCRKQLTNSSRIFCQCSFR